MQKRILLVDDESSLRRTLSLSLGQRGYETEPCENGMNALKRLETLMKSHIPLNGVVIDIQLPDILGTKLAKIIKFKYPGLPVILITGYADKLNPEEISNLKIQALIEKPLSAEQITAEFEKHLEIEKETESLVQPEKSEQLSQSTYMLVKLAEDANFVEVYQKLYFMNNVLYCDATKGDYDIILLVQYPAATNNSQELFNQVENITGIESIEMLNVEKPVLADNVAELIHTAEDAMSQDSAGESNKRDLGQRVCSYILMEVDKEKLDEIYPVLRLDDQVLFCDFTSGKYNLALFVFGSYFTDIDKFMAEKILPMEGILKVKEFPIINLFEM